MEHKWNLWNAASNPVCNNALGRELACLKTGLHRNWLMLLGLIKPCAVMIAPPLPLLATGEPCRRRIMRESVVSNLTSSAI